MANGYAWVSGKKLFIKTIFLHEIMYRNLVLKIGIEHGPESCSGGNRVEFNFIRIELIARATDEISFGSAWNWPIARWWGQRFHISRTNYLRNWFLKAKLSDSFHKLNKVENNFWNLFLTLYCMRFLSPNPTVTEMCPTLRLVLLNAS